MDVTGVEFTFDVHFFVMSFVWFSFTFLFFGIAGMFLLFQTPVERVIVMCVRQVNRLLCSAHNVHRETWEVYSQSHCVVLCLSVLAQITVCWHRSPHHHTVIVWLMCSANVLG